MKNIKDYLHLYLGCQCRRPHDGKVFTLKPLSLELAYIDKWQPILRPLSGMTDSEEAEFCSLRKLTTDGVHTVMMYHDTPASFLYLLSKQFDIFNLISEGLALDKTKI